MEPDPAGTLGGGAAPAPFFSIVVPCCDVADYVAECFGSVLSQSFGDWECVVWIEESRDGTEAIVRSFAARDSRFRVHTGPRTGSCSVPRNRGVGAARGEYIVFLDGDDSLVPGSLARIAAAIEARPGADLYPCAVQVHDDCTGVDGELRDNYPADAPAELSGPEASILAYRHKKGRVHPQLQLNVFRRAFLRENALECIPGICNQDSEFSPRALYLARRVAPLHEPISVYRIRPGSVQTVPHPPGWSLNNLAVVFHSLLAFHVRVSRAKDFDSRVAVSWENAWVSIIIDYWFGIRNLRRVPRSRRRETLSSLFAGGFGDFDRLLRVAPFRHRAAAFWIRLFVRHPGLAGLTDCFFGGVYNRLSAWKTARSGNPRQNKPRALLYCPCLRLPMGGASHLGILLISALQEKFDVTVAVYQASDIPPAAAWLGVPVNAATLRVVRVRPSSDFLAKLDRTIPFYRTRILRRLAKDSRLCISTDGIRDFGKPAHHFIAGLTNLDDTIFCDFHSHGPALRIPFRRKLRRWIGDRILRPLLSVRSVREILADPRERIYPNSKYTEKSLQDYYGCFNSRIFLPPTLTEIPETDVPRDSLSIVYIGRLVVSKRIEELIGIVERARALSGKDFRLALAGHLGGDSYSERISGMIARRPWCRHAGVLGGRDKDAFLASGSYAVHTRRDEEFGIAVTEYLKAGVIPVVPDEGGAAEVVAFPPLSYRTDEDAALLLVRLANDEAFRGTCRRHCAARALLFTRKAYFDRQDALLAEIARP